MSNQDRERVQDAVEALVDLILLYAERWGAGPTEQMCEAFSKFVRWVIAFGTGRAEANAKEHVFSRHVILRTHD